MFVEEKKEGIGAAYFQGFDYAAKKLGADVVVEFDGDFQHPPAAIPLLLAKIDATLDPLLGSNKFRASVSVECDFAGSEQSEEVFDPARSVMASSSQASGLNAGSSNMRRCA